MNGTTACKWDSVIPFDEMWSRLKALRKERTPVVLFGSEPFSSALRMSNIKEYKYDWIWNKKFAGNFLLAKFQPLKTHENILVFCKHIYFPVMIKRDKPIQKGKNSVNSGSWNLVNTKKEYNKKIYNKKYPESIILYSSRSDRIRIHPTQKPVKLMEYIIKTYTNEGDLILDFTCGSGSTGVAANKLNRSFIGIDNGICEKKNSKYFNMPWVEVARSRINE